MKTIIILPIFVLLLAGCSGVRLTDGQAQQLAQAQADMNATAAVALKLELQPQLMDLITADLARINAALANADGMPAPLVSAATLIADPAACASEATNATEAERNPPDGFMSWTAIIVGVLGVVAVIGRFAPAITAVLPWFGPLWKACEVPVKLAAEMGWAVVATKEQKDADEAKGT